MTCQHCGRSFIPVIHNNKFCNPLCKRKHYERQRMLRVELIESLSKKCLTTKKFEFLVKAHKLTKREQLAIRRYLYGLSESPL